MHFFESAEYPAIILFALITALVASAIALITLGSIFLRRVFQTLRNKEILAAETLILDELSEHLIGYASISAVPRKELRGVIRRLNALKKTSVLFSEVMIQVLVRLKLSLAGSIGKMANSTYMRMRLREFTLVKLRSPFWFIKAQGLREVQEMHDTRSLNPVMKLTADDNLDIRIAAYAAMLQLSPESPFSFLATEKEEFTLWHEFILIDAIEKANFTTLPRFSEYLETENCSIIQLCLKLIVKYVQSDALPRLKSLLEHPDEMVRNQAICTIGKLTYGEAAQSLIDGYAGETALNKSAILTALGEIDTPGSLTFVREQFLRSDDFSILKNAAAAIKNLSVDAGLETILSEEPLGDDQKALIRHFNEPLNA